MDNKERKGLIYIIRNIVNDKVYIGQTVQDVHVRFKEHMRKTNVYNCHFYKAINKYGKDKFYYDIVEDNIPESKLDEKEAYYIYIFESFKKGYNSTTGGDFNKRLKNIPSKELLNDINGNISQNDISKIYGISRGTINLIIKNYGIEWKNKNHYKNKPTIDEILPFKGLLSQKEIAKKLGVSVRVIEKIIAKEHIKWKEDIEKPTKEQLIEWNGKRTLRDIADEFGIGSTTVAREIKKYNIDWKRPTKKSS